MILYMTSVKKKKVIPKLRAWGKPSRKVMTMVIPTEKNKLKKRSKRKEVLRKELEEYAE